jgi:hypothetical protein
VVLEAKFPKHIPARLKSIAFKSILLFSMASSVAFAKKEVNRLGACLVILKIQALSTLKIKSFSPMLS